MKTALSILAVMACAVLHGADNLLQTPEAPFAQSGKIVSEGKCLTDRIVFGNRAVIFSPDGRVFFKTERFQIPLGSWFGIASGGKNDLG